MPGADIESTLAERDVGRDMIEREQAAIALGEAAIDALEEMWANLPTQEPSILESQLQVRRRRSTRRAASMEHCGPAGNTHSSVLKPFPRPSPPVNS